MPGPLLDDFQIFRLFWRKYVLFNQFKITQNTCQWRAQVVGDIGNLPPNILFTLFLAVDPGKGLSETAVDLLCQLFQMRVRHRHLQMAVRRRLLIHLSGKPVHSQMQGVKAYRQDKGKYA